MLLSMRNSWDLIKDLIHDFFSCLRFDNNLFLLWNLTSQCKSFSPVWSAMSSQRNSSSHRKLPCSQMTQTVLLYYTNKSYEFLKNGLVFVSTPPRDLRSASIHLHHQPLLGCGGPTAWKDSAVTCQTAGMLMLWPW